MLKFYFSWNNLGCLGFSIGKWFYIDLFPLNNSVYTREIGFWARFGIFVRIGDDSFYLFPNGSWTESYDGERRNCFCM